MRSPHHANVSHMGQSSTLLSLAAALLDFDTLTGHCWRMSKRYHHFDNTCILQSHDSGPVELLRESENGCLPSPLSLKPNHLIHDSIPAASCRPVRQPGVAFWKESIAIMKICRTLPKGICVACKVPSLLPTTPFSNLFKRQAWILGYL
jgi:hypothetical protein